MQKILLSFALGVTLLTVGVNAQENYQTPDEVGYTHIVVFAPKGNFQPQDPGPLLNAFNEPVFKANINTGYFRTKPSGGKLYGAILTKDPDGVEKALKNSKQVEFVQAKRLTAESFAKHEQSPQLSLSAEDAEKLLQSVRKTSWFQLLNEKQKRYFEMIVNYSFYDYDPKNFNVPDKEVAKANWLKLLKGTEPVRQERGKTTPYATAIMGAAMFKCEEAKEPLVRIACERKLKDNAYRHIATQALGTLGDPSVIPDLIPLVYHFNMETRWDAQISLVRLTKQNFGADADKWIDWYNANRSKLGENLPEMSKTRVDWTCGSDDPELKKYADPAFQREMDAR